jgi:hypothetical protein
MHHAMRELIAARMAGGPCEGVRLRARPVTPAGAPVVRPSDMVLRAGLEDVAAGAAGHRHHPPGDQTQPPAESCGYRIRGGWPG